MSQDPQHPLRILVVDDERSILEAYRLILLSAQDSASSATRRPHPRQEDVLCVMGWCYEFTLCAFAEDAVAAVQFAVEADKPYAMAFLDVHMPPGQSGGLWIAQQIRALDPDLAIVIVTGGDDLDVRQLVQQIPPPDRLFYIQKPFHPRELIQFVLALGARWQAERDLRRAHEELELRVRERTAELAAANAQLRQEIEERRKTEERLRTITTQIADAIVIVDDHEAVCFVNPAAERLLRRPAAELVGKPWPLSHGLSSGEIEIPTSSADPAIGEIRVVPIEWEGRPATLATIRDITERKRMQEALDRSRLEQIELKDQFLSHVSHELRTPLAVIHQFVSILRDGIGGELTDDQREYLDITMQNVEQLQGMINDLLDATRVQTGRLRIEPEPINLQELIADVVASLRVAAEKKGVALLTQVPDDLPLAFGDPDRVRQVLVNLIGNALKFTDQGGRVVVSAQDGSPEEGIPDGFLLVRVSDSGRGFPPEQRERIFEYLYQAQAEDAASRQGLGLGLFICRELISRHGGQIWAESEPGLGSTFSFTLPRAYQAAGGAGDFAEV